MRMTQWCEMEIEVAWTVSYVCRKEERGERRYMTAGGDFQQFFGKKIIRIQCKHISNGIHSLTYSQFIFHEHKYDIRKVQGYQRWIEMNKK